MQLSHSKWSRAAIEGRPGSGDPGEPISSLIQVVVVILLARD